LRAEYIGPDMIHARMHIVVQRGIPIEEADRITEEVRNRDRQDTGGHYSIIHVDPARMNGCPQWAPFKRRQIKQMEEERP
jgi:divalent metal cation (Fe/Co/Zn/Cd) transporter